MKNEICKKIMKGVFIGAQIIVLNDAIKILLRKISSKKNTNTINVIKVLSKHEIKKGLKDGSVIFVNGQYYKVCSDDEE